MKSSFPNVSQFTPEQISLPELLLIIKNLQPDRKSMTQAIGERFFSKSKSGVSIKLANNTILALSEYKLLDKPTNNTSYAALTELGESLAAKAQNNQYDELYEEFARHILLNLHGLELIRCVDDLVTRGTTITKFNIAKELSNRGLYLPPNGTHLNGMRQWLEKAELVDEGKWEAKPLVLKKILGDVGNTDIDDYALLSREQRAFALAFARLDKDEALSNKVAKYASELYGVEFPEGGLPQSTLFALRDVGLITCEKTTGGQGAKPYIVRRTDKLKKEFLEPIFKAIEDTVGIQYRKLIRMSFEEILTGLSSDSKHKKGIALEALSFYLGRLIGLEFVKWRLRSNQTGGAELDVIMEGTNLIFSRWQIQCKNSHQATLDDVAKEVGLAQIINSNVIMVVTTGSIGEPARKFAERVMKDTNYQVILMNKSHLLRIKNDPSEITEILNSQAKQAMTLKRGQIDVI